MEGSTAGDVAVGAMKISFLLLLMLFVALEPRVRAGVPPARCGCAGMRRRAQKEKKVKC